MANSHRIRASGDPPKHEPSEVRGFGFLLFLIGFVVLAVLVHVTIYYSYRGMLSWRAPSPASPLARETPLPPAPRVEGTAAHPALPSEDLATMRRHERQRLSSYGWTDRRAGRIHIPIRRAMQLVLDRGLPHAEPTTRRAEE